MALLDAAYILAAVRSSLNEVSSVTWIDDQLNKWIQEAAIDISIKTLGYEEATNVDISASTLEASEPDGTIKIHSCVLSPSSTVTLDTVLDTLEFDTVDCLTPMAVHIGGDYYAVAYQSSDGDGWIRTFSISAAGVITAVDNWEFNTTNGADPTLYHISGDVYLVAASANGTGALYTFEISTVGVITKSIIDTEALTDAHWSISTLVNITGDVYSVSWRKAAATQISTYTITVAGDITLIDNYSYALTNLFPSWSYLVAANIVMDVILATANEFRVTTYGISDAGSITTPYLDTQAISLPGDTYQRTWGVEVTSNIFAITMQSADGGGYVATFGVDDAGSIDAAVTDSYQYAASVPNDSNGHIVALTQAGAFLLTYQGADGDGFMQIIDIDSAGDITARAASPVEFDTSHGFNPFALPDNGAYIPVFYAGPGVDGFIKTIGVTTETTTGYKGLSRIHPRLVQHVAHNETGEPIHYYHHHEKIGIWPLPDETYIVKAYCSKVTETITDLPTELRLLAIPYCLAMARLSEGWEDDFEMFIKMYLNSVMAYRADRGQYKLNTIDAKDKFQIPLGKVVNA